MADPGPNSGLPPAADYDTDEISLTSTVEDGDGDYAVDEVLDEWEDNGKTKYLIRWLGYPDMESTWVPDEDIHNPEITLAEWNIRKVAVARGEVEPFDLEAWTLQKEEYNRAKATRKKKRAKKRAKIKAAKKKQARVSSRKTRNPRSSPSTTTTTPKPVSAKRKSHLIAGFIADDDETTDASEATRRKSLRARASPQATAHLSKQTVNLREQDEVADPEPNDDEPTSRGAKSADPNDTERPPASRRKSVTATLENGEQEPSRRTQRRASDIEPSQPQPKNFRTISQLGRAKKAGQDERPPDMSAISWTDMRTGETTRPQASTAVASVANPSPPPADPLDKAPPPHPPSEPPAPVPAAPQLTKAEAEELAIKSGKIPMTCYRWSHEHCTFSDDECPYLHVATGKTGSPNGAECHFPKYAKPPLTCFWWFETRFCRLSEDDCHYAHWNTGLIATLDKALPPRKVATSELPRSVQDKDVTCFFWTQKACFNPESMCKYAHRWCDVVAPPPPGYAPPTRNLEQLAPPEPEPLAPPGPEQLAPRSPETEQPADADNPIDVDADVNAHVDAGAAPNRSEANIDLHPLPDDSPAPPSPTMFPVSTEQDSTPLWATKTDHAYNVHLAVPSADDTNATVRFEVQMAFDSEEDKRNFNDSLEDAFQWHFGRLPSIRSSKTLFRVDRSIAAEDMERFSKLSMEDVLFSGDILPTEESTEAVLRYADGLALQTGGSLTYFPSIHSPKFTLIITPNPHRMEAWKFLPATRDSASDVALRFVVMKPLSRTLADLSLTTVPSLQNSVSHAEILFATLFKANLSDLFVYPAAEERSLDKEVLLMFPADVPSDIELVTRILEAYGCTVYFGHKPGVFVRFTKTIDRGLVIFHPFVRQYHKIPNLSALLSNKRYNFHAIGPNADLLWKGDHPQMEYTHQWLFPHGGVVFLTDNLLAFSPRSALQIIQQFIKKRWRGAPTKGWRLFFRPGIKEWVLQLAQRNKDEVHLGNDPTRLQIVQAIDDLVKFDEGRRRSDDPDEIDWHLSEKGPIVSPLKKHMPEIAALWDENTAGKEKSLERMVEYFCGWAIDHAHCFRRFIIVHPHERPTWREQYQHVTVVTPEKYLERYT